MENQDSPSSSKSAALARKWIKEINDVLNSREQKNFESVGEKIIKNYRNYDVEVRASSTTVPTARVMYNVLWSNVQVLKPTLYSRMPKVVVERRFKDSDPIGRLACRICERATSFSLATQQDRFNYAVKAAVEDRLLPGRGEVWLRYEVDFEDVAVAEGQDVEDDRVVEKTIKPNSERVVIDPIHWKDYIHSPARNVYEIRWIAKRAYMSRSELVERFGDIGEKLPLTHGADTNTVIKSQVEEQNLTQAEVWEIWDKQSKRVTWICLNYDESILDQKDDPLRVCDFWPCPDPLLATTTTDTSYPVADYKIYERLADELDYVTKRISSLIECIKFVGATSAAFNSDVKNMLQLRDGQLWPIENWVRFAESGGLNNAIDWLPFDKAVAAIDPLMGYRNDLLDKINSITGIPDIALGSSDPTETLGSQQLKSRWTVVKIQEKQQEVQRFCRQIISKIAEIIFEPGLFSDETISLMCGYSQLSPEEQALYPEALALLRSDRIRSFRVDIETDSTIATDEEEDKTSRMEYISAINSLMSNLQGISQFRPELLSPMIESALFAARAFRTGRPLEGSWEQALKKIEENDALAAQQPQLQLPDYESQKLALQAQELSIKQAHENFDQFYKTQQMQAESVDKQFEFELKTQELELEGLKIQNDAQFKAMEQELNKFKEDFAQAVETRRLELERYTSILDEKEKLLEETRLKQANELEMIKILHEQKVIEAKNEASEKYQTKRKVIKMARTPEGHLIGESLEVPEVEI